MQQRVEDGGGDDAIAADVAQLPPGGRLYGEEIAEKVGRLFAGKATLGSLVVRPGHSHRQVALMAGCPKHASVIYFACKSCGLPPERLLTWMHTDECAPLAIVVK